MNEQERKRLLRLGGIRERDLHTQCAIRHWRNRKYMINSGLHEEALSGTMFCARYCDNDYECPYVVTLGCNYERKTMPTKCMPCLCARPTDPIRLDAFLRWLDKRIREFEQDKLERRAARHGHEMVPAI